MSTKVYTQVNNPFLLSHNDSIINMPVISEFNEDTKKYKSEYYKNVKSPSTVVVNFVPRMFFLFGCAFISLWGIVSLVKTIPDLSLPTSIEAVKKQAIILENYSNGT